MLSHKAASNLVKEIISNYNDIPKFGTENRDIRQSLFNYDNPMYQNNLNGVDLRITMGLIEYVSHSTKKKQTYLLYANGLLVGKATTPHELIEVLKYYERLTQSSEPHKTEHNNITNKQTKTKLFNH